MTTPEDQAATIAELRERLREAEEAIQPPETWFGDGLTVALEHGYTETQYRAAKAIEYRIFGFYEWKNQGDRAASMMVQICHALKEATEAAEARANAAERALVESDARVAALRKALTEMQADYCDQMCRRWQAGHMHECEEATRVLSLPAPSPSKVAALVLVPVEPTDAMLRAACEAAGWWAKPYTAPRECGVPIECDMSQEDADLINKDGMEAMRKQYKAMLAAARALTGEPEGG